MAAKKEKTNVEMNKKCPGCGRLLTDAEYCGLTPVLKQSKNENACTVCGHIPKKKKMPEKGKI